MKKTKRIISIVITLAMLLSALCLFAYAADGNEKKYISHIEVIRKQPAEEEGEGTEEPTEEEPAEGTPENPIIAGSLSDAILKAGDGGEVIIYGSVATQPISKNSIVEVDNITIRGYDENAYLSLPTDYLPLKFGLDLITVTGSNVTIKDLTIDASYQLDGALGIAKSASNVTVENVIAMNGGVGSVNIYSSNNIKLKNVQARNCMQAGFYICGVGDASALTFTDCKTFANLYCGVIVSNSTGAATNVNCGGIQCYENCFGIFDKDVDNARADLTLKKAPKNANGNSISKSSGVHQPIVTVADFFRFGDHPEDKYTSTATMKTSRYGFETTLYFDDTNAANELSDGDKVEKVKNPDNGFFGWLKRIFVKIYWFFANLF